MLIVPVIRRIFNKRILLSSFYGKILTLHIGKGDYMIKAVITMENGKSITLELYEEAAPITVENFKSLAKKGYYNGLIFHRVIKGFMIQGGDPTGTGTGGPGYHIKGEFLANKVPNSIKHGRGTISMARSSDFNSAGSQFFIMHQDAPHLDGQYAAFGKVTAGMETIDEIASQKTNYSDRPITEQKIKSIEIIE